MVIIAHNIRSAHNVGALMRTAEGLGIAKLYLTGYTPYPKTDDDLRLPHIAHKIDQQIHKTALGAEHSLDWQYQEDVNTVIDKLREQEFTIAALEQTDTSVSLPIYQPPNKLALLLGSEVTGVDPALLACTDIHLEIPMFGKKESFNVVEATTMAMYHCTVWYSKNIHN